MRNDCINIKNNIIKSKLLLGHSFNLCKEVHVIKDIICYMNFVQVSQTKNKMLLIIKG